MTEADWLSCTDPEPMLSFLRDSGKLSDRKARLFAVACCRHLLRQVHVNARDERAVEVAERYADGMADAAELRRAAAGTTPDWTAAFACQEAASPEGGVDAAIYAADNVAWEAGSHAASLADEDDDSPSFAAGRDAARTAQAALLRDIGGDPFCPPPPLAPSLLAWNDGLIPRLATAAYEHRSLPSGHLDNAHLSVLADALEDAGCTDASLLEHLRGEGPHWRGCWAVDTVLAKG